MPKKPEQVLRQDEVTASSRVEKGRVEISVRSIVNPPASTRNDCTPDECAPQPHYYADFTLPLACLAPILADDKS